MKCRMSYSDTRGRDFNNWRHREIGEGGTEPVPVTFWRLGQTTQRVYAFEVTDDVIVDIVAAQVR